VLGMSRPSCEPARWALTRAPCDLGRKHTPILDELGQSPLPRSKLYKGCPVRARVPPRCHRPHHLSALLNPPWLLSARDLPPTLPHPAIQRVAHRWAIPAVAVGQHHCHGHVLLGDWFGPMTPRQWWVHAQGGHHCCVHRRHDHPHARRIHR
jgi:hypothetical protein